MVIFMYRILWFFLGMILCSIGLSFWILYLNLLTMGYSFWNFVYFISSRIECYLVLVGVVLMIISWKGKEWHELLLRRRIKF